MAATLPCVKKSNMFDTCGATVPTPFLLSPTSVAHRIQMLDSETERPATGNAIRDQWVANLQNKRMAAAAGAGDPVGSGHRSASSLSGTTTSTTGNSNSRSGLTTKSSCSCSAASRVAAMNRNAAQSSAVTHAKSLTTRQVTAHRPRLVVDSQVAMSDTDAITLEHPTMLFNEMGGYELESPRLSRLMSSPTTITKESRGWMKRGTKAGSNKRAIHYVALHADQSNSRAPCRKRKCGSAKSDIFDFDFYSMISNASDFPDVETPASISVDASCANTRYLWGQDLDFSGAGGYADTFLDVPTSEFAETPLLSTSQWSHISSNTSTSSKQLDEEEDAMSRVDQLQSLHTSSIEQKGFNDFFEQTNSDSMDDDELFQLATTPLVSVDKSPFSEDFCFTPITTAATACCGDKSATLSLSWQMSSPSPVSTSSRPDASTARCRLIPCDPKCPPEFETLMDEYNITDIDHELDGFYLDTMEVIENGLD